MKTAKKVSALLNNMDDQLIALQQHCQLIQAVAKLVSQCLPEPLTKHCQVINLKEDLLILQTDSPTWNTLLRYQTPELLAQLQRSPNLAHLKSIRVKTTPATQTRSSRHRTPSRQLNPDSAALL